MAYGTHHTVDIWCKKNVFGKYDVVLRKDEYDYRSWAQFADQHEAFPRPRETFHVCVHGGHFSRAYLETFVLACEFGLLATVTLRQE